VQLCRPATVCAAYIGVCGSVSRTRICRCTGVFADDRMYELGAVSDIACAGAGSGLVTTALTKSIGPGAQNAHETRPQMQRVALGVTHEVAAWRAMRPPNHRNSSVRAGHDER
jgi:hypothetical protein